MIITKRSGKNEERDDSKILEMLEWAVEGLGGVTAASVLMQAKISFYAGMTTSEIHDCLVKAASDLITEFTPAYQYVAGRLLMAKLRKEAYGEYDVPNFFNHIEDMIQLGKYDTEILERYNPYEVAQLSNAMDHNRDMNFTYAAMIQMQKKYLTQDRVKNVVFESPQVAYMLIGMCLHQDEVSGRMDKVIDFYEAVSTFKISLPSPIIAGVRSPLRQFSSCVLIESGDDLESINEVSSAIVTYSAARAGLGINAGRIRSHGAPIRDGDAYHTGSIGFYKYFQSAMGSCSQGGLRKGSATLFYPWWHKDFQSLIVLKNNKGTDDNRVRHMDYGVQLNKTFYKALTRGESIKLVCPNAMPGLYDAFFADQPLFEKLYQEACDDPDVLGEWVKASDMMGMLMQERSSTGRIYIQHVDHCNVNGPFIPEHAPIKQSNLCLEIALPTKPLGKNGEGEIALCTLAAFNMGVVSIEELPHLSRVIVRALDNLLDYQNYPVEQAEVSLNRRSLGIGVINYAHALAKRGLKYSDGSANNFTHEWFEAMQYNLVKASVELAKEHGPCKYYLDTKYGRGMVCLDWYNKRVDKIVKPSYSCDWEGLRAELSLYGIRNSTLTALMPAETSAIVSNATNGIEPPRALTVTKSSKDGKFKVVVPQVQELFDQYEFVWDMPSNKGYIELVAIMQKFVDQAISANTNYNPFKFPGNKVPLKVLTQDVLTAYTLGLKTLYYHNTYDGSGEDIPEDEGCGDSCKI